MLEWLAEVQLVIWLKENVCKYVIQKLFKQYIFKYFLYKIFKHYLTIHFKCLKIVLVK